MENVSLFVASPCYGGSVHTSYMKSILSLQSICNHFGIQFMLFTIDSESLIPRARNVCASAFLKSGFSHMIFIDADIQFDPDDIISMIKKKKGIIGGNYPTKHLQFDAIEKSINEKQCLNIQQLVSQSVNYTAHGLEKEVNNGLVKCTYIGTGFMLIKRDVLISLIENVGDTIKY